MDLFFIISNIALFCFGFLYPSFRLFESYSYLVIHSKNDKLSLEEKKEKVHKYRHLMKKIVKHFLAMVFSMLITTFTDFFLKNSIIYVIIKIFILAYFVNGNYSGASTVMEFMKPKLMSTFEFIFRFAEHSKENGAIDNAHFLLSHFVNVFKEQYMKLLNDINDIDVPDTDNTAKHD